MILDMNVYIICNYELNLILKLYIAEILKFKKIYCYLQSSDLLKPYVFFGNISFTLSITLITILHINKNTGDHLGFHVYTLRRCSRIFL